MMSCNLLVVACWIALARSAFTQGYSNASDLTHFVTRPEIKAPLFNVTVFDEENVATGYWFLGPYANLIQPSRFGTLFYPCQTGPHIFDQNGDLVWSGACAFENRVACDVRTFQANGSSFISAIFTTTSSDAKGYGIIMDQTYNVTKRLDVAPGMSIFNMHELTFVDDGTRALYLINRPLYVDLESFLVNVKGVDSGLILDLGVREVDLASGKTTFVWWASDHIALEESSATFKDYQQQAGGWNWLHINSVNKNKDGDYLISARFTDCIYKISGKDGSILWRLGGKQSDFELVNFNFSRQHDAQWLEYDDKTELISFLDNGADNFGYSTSSVSSALVVQIDKTSKPPQASIVQRIWRPDGGVSQLRGNIQNLPNGNKFIGWSDNAYITEHAPDGRLLMQATYSSERFVTYRAYKADFEGFPVEKPVVHAEAYRAGDTSITAFWVSWNGATNVATWRFWRVVEDAEPSVIGDAPRSGFETTFQSEGSELIIFAEALDHEGVSLGQTDKSAVKSPLSGGGSTVYVQSKKAHSDGQRDEL